MVRLNYQMILNGLVVFASLSPDMSMKQYLTNTPKGNWRWVGMYEYGFYVSNGWQPRDAAMVDTSIVFADIHPSRFFPPESESKCNSRLPGVGPHGHSGISTFTI